MTPADLATHRAAISARYLTLKGAIDGLTTAPENTASHDYQSDAYAEALFLRAFTAYESDLEKLFLHYVTGGHSLNGRVANTFLKITDEAAARKLTKAGYKFLSWAKPQETRTTAENYIENGWPISAMMSAKSQDLSDCERIRNRIAHNSLEASNGFGVVQRNQLQTERVFDITPGQFLRIRNTRLRKTHIQHYVSVMNETLDAIFSPPP